MELISSRYSPSILKFFLPKFHRGYILRLFPQCGIYELPENFSYLVGCLANNCTLLALLRTSTPSKWTSLPVANCFPSISGQKGKLWFPPKR